MILPEIDSFDRKRLLQNFVVHSGSVYVSYDAGYVSQLYIDGLEVHQLLLLAILMQTITLLR